MTCVSAWRPWIIALCFGALWAGCTPLGRSELDDEKNPFYLDGMNRLQRMEYRAAAESFEKALEANPRSAAAHLQLGLLYQQHMSDSAAAIYHFQKFLKLRPDSNLALTIQDRIENCRLELAGPVSYRLASQQAAREIERLSATNAVLRQVIDQQRQQLAQQAALLSSGVASVARESGSLQDRSRQGGLPDRPEYRPVPPPTAQGSTSSRASDGTRVHIVRRGETIFALTRLYGVSRNEILAANPRITDPNTIKPGQRIVIPASD